MTTTNRRLRACVENWPDAETGAYDPRCCRFPKSCSATVYDEGTATEVDLEPVTSTPAEPGDEELFTVESGPVSRDTLELIAAATGGGIRSREIHPVFVEDDPGDFLPDGRVPRRADVLAAYERGKAEERARQFDHAKLAAVICATRDDAVHQILAEDYVCGDCEEIAQEIQQHFATGGSDAA